MAATKPSNPFQSNPPQFRPGQSSPLAGVVRDHPGVNVTPMSEQSRAEGLPNAIRDGSLTPSYPRQQQR